MHQHPRPPPAMASPANSEQTNPTRTNNPRDRDVERVAAESTHDSGSSDDFAAARQDQPIERLNQVVRNFHTKAALIILHSRVELMPAYSKGADTRRVNKWFNIELDETEDYKEDIRLWKTCDLKDDRPPPLVIEIYINIDTLNPGQRLALLDDEGKRWDVKHALESASSLRDAETRQATGENEVVLERWNIELSNQTMGLPSDMAATLPLVYKKSIVLFRSLFTYCNFLPAFKLSRKVSRSGSRALVKLNYRILDGRHVSARSQFDTLTTPLCEGTGAVVSDYSFGVTDSPAGPFSVSVTYRQNCDFRVDDSEELLSRQLLGSGNEFFKPSLPREEQGDASELEPSQEARSLPTDRRSNLMERPGLGHAYGSLSTFHRAGISPGTSPLSALRNAQEYSTEPPSPTSDPSRAVQAPHLNQSSRATLRPAVTTGRRSSFSFQPFKAPVLSASALMASPLAGSPRPSITKVPTLAALAEEQPPFAPAVQSHVARKSISLAPEQAIPSSSSSSPKPGSVPRYSSSFSHRRARLSSGGTTKVEDDQNSSGKTSTTSAQPGSGLVVEATGGDSSGSMQEDDANISDFLKMLDSSKNLLTPSDAAAVQASTKRTTAALVKYHRMRESNAALSDSMSSSLMMHRSSSSSSRQLSSVPPMVAATSVSTSSSPGKPISPHTPHTPFAPSRLSAAFSHDEAAGDRLGMTEPQSASEAASDSTTRTESTAIAPPIDIPSSPRPPLATYRRSSSARRDILPVEEDFGGLYGVRAGSMGAHERRIGRREPDWAGELTERPATGAAPVVGTSRARRGEPSHHPSHLNQTQVASGNDITGSTSASGLSSAPVYRSRAARGAGRGMTPPQGSTSSFGATGGSFDRDRDSAGSVGSGSWGRGAGRRTGSKPENRFDDDEFLFAMEKSDFTSAAGGMGETSKR